MVSLQCSALHLRHPRGVVLRPGRAVTASLRDETLCSIRTFLATSLLLLALLRPDVVEGSVGAGEVRTEDPFFKVEVDNATYPDEKHFLEVKKKTGDKTLFAPKGTFYMYVDAPAEAQLELARLQLKRAGEPTDVVDRGAKRLAALSKKYAVINDGGKDVVSGTAAEEGWVNVGGTGSVWNLDSFRTFCPEVERIAVTRMRGITRVFRLPSSLYQNHGLSSVEKKDYAAISNDLLPRGDPETDEKAPIGTVLRMPPYCFVRFLWREKLYDLVSMDVDVVKEDNEKKIFVETGEKLRAYIPVDSSDEQLKWKIGYVRFREIVEQRAHNPQQPLQEFLDGQLQHTIKNSCLRKVPASPEDWSLRRCFFEMDRDTLYGILGHQQWNARWGKPLGLESTWKKGFEVYPNIVYLRVCLCGAKKASDSIAKDMAATSYLYDNKTTVKEWLVSGKGSLDIPYDKPIPEAYAMARDCSVEELMSLIKDDTGRA